MVKAQQTVLEAAGREVAITNPDKLFFPRAGHTKLDLARYYLAVTTTEQVTLPIAHELGRPAHDEWRWVTFDEAEDVLPPRLTAVLEWVRSTLEPA